MRHCSNVNPGFINHHKPLVYRGSASFDCNLSRFINLWLTLMGILAISRLMVMAALLDYGDIHTGM